MNTEITQEEFNKLAKNRNLYRVEKKLKGQLCYAKVGDTYYSDTLFELDYNTNQLVKDGFLSLVEEPFEWQKEIVGKNVKTVYCYCPNCQSFAVNLPLDIECGNCSHPKMITYYDAQTINNLLNPTA